MDLDDLFSDSVDDKIDLKRAIGQLDFREATVLYLWACCEYSQAEVGEIVKLSQQHVSRILANMCKKS